METEIKKILASFKSGDINIDETQEEILKKIFKEIYPNDFESKKELLPICYTTSCEKNINNRCHSEKENCNNRSYKILL